MLLTRRIAALGLSIFVILFYLLRPRKLHHHISFLHYGHSSDKIAADIWNSTFGFQNIFVINIPERTDRRDAITLAAALSEIDITWVDGVLGGDVSDKVLPADSKDKSISRGNKGSWRAHMNALQTIIHHNLTSALIIEDDADWDLRIKSQLQVFAEAARAFTQPTISRPGLPKQQPVSLAEVYNPAHASPNTVVELPFTRLPYHELRPTLTPYGDDWDVLWLGHCGTEFPQASTTQSPSSEPPAETRSRDTGSEDSKLAQPRSVSPHRPPRVSSHSHPALLRIPILDDLTVPEPQHLKPHPFALHDSIVDEYPPHTRVVHASSGTICTQAYAVSQQGARKLLWQFGVESLTNGWDLMLRDWCDGAYFDGGGDGTTTNSERRPVCVTVQPPLFSHHYGKGSASDIMAPGGGFLNKNREMTPYVRYSIRLNMARLVSRGSNVVLVDDLLDQYPDS